MSDAASRRPSFISSLIYRDNRAALSWLQEAFGFVPSEVLTDSDGNVVHAEMRFGDGIIMIGNEWADWTLSPASLGDKNTQRIHVRVDGDVDAHFAQAKKCGARIVKEPEDQFYGERSYIAADLEGHRWTFSKHLRDVSRAEMEAATGFKFAPLKQG